MTQELNFNDYRQYLKPRPRECHKGDFGRVLIIGGNFGFSGAALLAGSAALRVGAGSVSIATRAEIATVLNVSCPELMCHGIENPSALKSLLDAATIIVIGPGLGMDKWANAVLKVVLERDDKPTLFDADGLNLLAQYPPLKRTHCIYTPHPGEAARLIGMTPAQIQLDRNAALCQLQAFVGGHVVLKGHGTCILSTGGEIEKCTLGNPGMASGGMGDVLSGVIAGLCAQKIPVREAVRLGVLVHAMAGDLAAKLKGERGLVASDLIACLQTIVNPSGDES